MEPDKVDLSPLDPARDPRRWAALVDAISDRVVAARRRRRTISWQLVAWGRPVLAAAATVVVLAAAGVVLGDGAAAGGVDAGDDARSALVSWAAVDEVPPPEMVLRVLGGAHGED